jgi:hypothetical protein
MFNPIPHISPQCLLAPLAASLVFGSFGAMAASAQIIIFPNRGPIQVAPNSRRDSYIDKSPIINNTPAPSPIIQPSPSPYDDYSPLNPRRIRQRTVIDQRHSPSGTQIFINPTVVIPGGYGSRYPHPYPYPQGSSIYHSPRSGFQIQIGY